MVHRLSSIVHRQFTQQRLSMTHHEPAIEFEIQGYGFRHQLQTNPSRSADYGSAPEPNSVNICPGLHGVAGCHARRQQKGVRTCRAGRSRKNCSINKHNTFARKKLLLPRPTQRYQISQYELPIAEKGYLTRGWFPNPPKGKRGI
ncbi:MAG: hypothetical protein IPG80_18495 [Anaerolineales bacterium]|uniref:hypothetical protein n=1 Tax=Candidatus Villigracilis vicinus TaxID=3140679 RepID=UPI003136C28D|nr:hypothetical protein [Anaerolineales bacterium]